MTNPDRPDHAADLRRSLRDPVKLCRDLGIADKLKRLARGEILVCCPWHSEKTPSCSVKLRGDGTLSAKCFGCERSGDALSLIAAVYGLDIERSFQDVLLAAAELAGRHDVIDEIRGVAPDQRRAPARPVPARQDAPAEVPKDYPPAAEVEALWDTAGPVSDDPDASAHLVGRKLDPDAVTALNLARAIDRRTATDRLPRWAKHQGVWWRDSGHRMLVRAWDSDGLFRSVRAWRVRDGDTPKRLPPGGHRSGGLVLANAEAVSMLRGEPLSSTVVVAEGEPDWITNSLLRVGCAVLGVLSGSWHEGFAARIPFGAEVIVRTHVDVAGNKYADEIVRTVRDRAQIHRLVIREEDAA